MHFFNNVTLRTAGLNVAVFGGLYLLARLIPLGWHVQYSLVIAAALILLGLYSPWVWNGIFAAVLYGILTVFIFLYVPDERDIRVIILNRFGLIMAYATMAIFIYRHRHGTEKLQKSEARYRTLFEQSQDAVFITTWHGKILDVNDAGLRMFGYDRQDLIDFDARENWVNPDDRRLWAQLTETQGSVIEFPAQLRKKDGSVRDCLLSSMIQRDKKQAFVAYHVIIRDVTERKRAEEALQQSHEEVKRLKDRLQAENIYLQEEIKLEHNFDRIISRSDALKKALAKVEKVAATDSTVLILGETGTGKELLARAVHGISARKDRPLVKVNCAALPANLIESELFGHEKGAFTGAVARRIGRFELADGGTIFLDEIGELPPELQVKFLRVLQEGELERLGDSRTIHVDVRVIAATNRDLEKACKTGQFREDLFYRLNVFPIRVPPLRERKEDIPLLVHHLIQKYSARTGKRIQTVSQELLNTLQAYHWPGNIRELENIIERAVIISPGETLLLDDPLPSDRVEIDASVPRITLDELERQHIMKILEMTEWRVSGDKGAAKILGLKPTTLEARMSKLGICRPGRKSLNQ